MSLGRAPGKQYRNAREHRVPDLIRAASRVVFRNGLQRGGGRHVDVSSGLHRVPFSATVYSAVVAW
ncbi:MAG TPA: hypothetical protein VIG24_01705, partial [Acidimicrobiia bacterium]